MKKTFVVVIAAYLFLGVQAAYCADVRINQLRGRIFDASGQIKSALSGSQDVIIVTVMFDSCMLALSQIDGYYSLLTLLDTIKEKDLTPRSLDTVTSWINEIKRTNNANITSLQAMNQPFDPGTKRYVELLKGIFADLNSGLDVELNKLVVLRKRIKTK